MYVVCRVQTAICRYSFSSSSSSSFSKKVVAVLPRMIAHRLEGSRFGVYSNNLATFRLHVDATETRENGRLPRTSQRFACSTVACNRIEKPRVDASRWVIRGSRLLKTFFGRMGRWNEYRGVVWYAPKRLPPGGGRSYAVQRHQLFFENEDDDENA
jgi:hypothetical protein